MRRFGLLAAAMLLAASTTLARAQDYPIKPITLVVPFPAGGTTDVLMRTLGDAASKHLGQPVVVDNRAGGGGAIGPGTMAATAKPDGYTIAQIPVPVYRLPLTQKTAWSADDFTYIIHLTGYTFMLVAGENTPFRKWQDVVDFAKANPGKITYGTSGTGGTPHLGVEMISEKAGIKMTHVPLKGSAEADVALLGGHVMMIVGGTHNKPHVEAGKAHFLNIWTQNRAKLAPDIPTLKELGIPYVIDSSFGIAGPQNNTTERIDFPSCIRSNASLILSSGMVWVIRSSMLILPSMYQSTIFGTSVRPRAPPKAVPFQTRPVTSWNGRVAISLPASATPMMMLSPQPRWQHSSAWRITLVLPVQSNEKSAPPPVRSTIA
jgi:tripartite-type tricarboxylate transporter receptor subunit TctC